MKIAYFLFFLAFVKCALFSFFGFGLLDEGESLHNGQRILAGELPYKDFFAVFPPLHHYFYAASFSLFGQSVLVPRLMESLIFAFVPVLIYLICKRFSSGRYALIPAILVIFLDVNIERLYYFAPLLLGLYIFQRSVEKFSKKGFFWSGVFIGISGLARIDISGALVISLLIGSAIHFYLLDKSLWIKKLVVVCGYLFIGLLIPLGTVGIWIITQGLTYFFIDDTFLKIVYITKLHHLPFPSPLEVIPAGLSLNNLANSYSAVLGYCVLLIYGVMLVLIFRNWSEYWRKSPILGIFLIFGLLMLPYVFGRSDMSHFIKGGFPSLLLASFLLFKMRNKVIKLFCWGVIGLIFVACMAQSVWWVRFNNEEIMIGGNSLRINRDYVKNSTIVSAGTLKEAASFLDVNSSAKQPVLVLPYMAGLYFLADRMSPSQFDNVLNGYINTEAEEEEFINQIKRANIGVIVYDRSNGPKMQVFRFKDYNPLIDRYIMSNYDVVLTTPEGWLFMKKNDVK